MFLKGMSLKLSLTLAFNPELQKVGKKQYTDIDDKDFGKFKKIHCTFFK